jgi:hypothetical protein
VARSTYVVPSRNGGASGSKPAERTVRMISKVGTKPVTGFGCEAAPDAAGGAGGGDCAAAPGTNVKQNDAATAADITAAPNAPSLTGIPPPRNASACTRRQELRTAKTLSAIEAALWQLSKIFA